ncbi:MAG TPA: TolC family protein [Candidatus Sulfotelmatobacter sp.]|nr:TolC family protein [Candidatus Sulfotelmatobacter sp.]
MSMRHLFLNFAVLALIAIPCAAQSTQTLSLADAEKIAIQNHPQIQAAGYLAAAAQAQVTEARSVYYPQAVGSLTGVESETNSRISAGALNNPIIFDRYANGVAVSQLVTDFGHTHELVKSTTLHAQAQKANVLTSRADVLINVDRAYYNVLRSQAVLRVAEETVKTRQLVSDQITALEQNKLRSGLDVSFANVDLAQAQLLLIEAQNGVEASYADLSTALGYQDEKIFTLTEEPVPPAPPPNVADLISQALQNRPELISHRLDVRSAESYATAERDLWLPTITAVGAAGLAPVHEDLLGSRYAAAGFNVNIPLFNGHEFGALRAEANAKAQAQSQYLRDLQNGIVREVRKAWLESNAAFQRLSVTQQLLAQATQALDLAQQRYKLGLSSIIELSQAQLNMTQAEITQASAKYDYETAISTLNYEVGANH